MAGARCLSPLMPAIVLFPIRSPGVYRLIAVDPDHDTGHLLLCSARLTMDLAQVHAIIQAPDYQLNDEHNYDFFNQSLP